MAPPVQAMAILVGTSRAGRRGAGVSHRRQGRDSAATDRTQAYRRCPGCQRKRTCRTACGAIAGLRRVAACLGIVRPTARPGIRPGDRARHAADRADRIRASARARYGLSSVAAHRRAIAGYRTRYWGHQLSAALHAVQYHSHAARDRARGGHSAVLLQRMVCRDRGGQCRGLYRRHDVADRMAYPPCARIQPARRTGQYACGRQPAQLRNGQILRQRTL